MGAWPPTRRERCPRSQVSRPLCARCLWSLCAVEFCVALWCVVMRCSALAAGSERCGCVGRHSAVSSHADRTTRRSGNADERPKRCTRPALHSPLVLRSGLLELDLAKGLRTSHERSNALLI